MPISEEPISEEPISEEPISEEPISEELISEELISDLTPLQGRETNLTYADLTNARVTLEQLKRAKLTGNHA